MELIHNMLNDDQSVFLGRVPSARVFQRVLVGIKDKTYVILKLGPGETLGRGTRQNQYILGRSLRVP